ncbi:MAG: ribonuclease HI [Candidatus Hydrogenedentota bacterium]
MQHVIIYTDGGCDPNPGIGGWAAVLLSGKARKEISGGEPESTNNRMELTAAIEALDALKRPCRVSLHTDSEYVKRGITEWLPGWKAKNWKRKTGPLKNEDLWRRLDDTVQRHDIRWLWVKGHAGVAENERCDQLAAAEIAKLRTP